MSEARPLRLSLIRRDPFFWPRRRLCKTWVRELAELYRHGGAEALPPITVAATDGEGRHLLLDGWHREEAARQEGLLHLPAIIVPVASEQEAYEQALALTARGTRPMTTTEKRIAVDRLLETDPRRADYAIARIVAVSNHLVAKRRALLGKPAKTQEGNRERINPERQARAIMRAALALCEAAGDARVAAALAEAAREVAGPEAARVLANLAAWSASAAALSAEKPVAESDEGEP